MTAGANADGGTMEAAGVRNTTRDATGLPLFVEFVEISAMTLALVLPTRTKLPLACVRALGSPLSQAPLLLTSKQTFAFA